MQFPRHRSAVFPLPPRRLPIPLQCLPHRLPVLCRGFHHRFFHLLLDQPRCQFPQSFGSRPNLAALKLVCPFRGHVGYYNGQHLLVHVNSRYPVSHCHSPCGSREHAYSYLGQGHAAADSPAGEPTPNYSRKRGTLRIKQANGLDISTVRTISQLPQDIVPLLGEIFIPFHGPQAHHNRPGRLSYLLRG